MAFVRIAGWVALVGVALVGFGGCGGSGDSSGSGSGNGGVNGANGSGGPTFNGTGNGDGGASGACTGLACQQHACANGTTTTISGTVYDPALKNPLYDVVVYVPNAPVQALPAGASCASCNQLYTGDPIATALTDAQGKFTLQKAPDGPNIPLVVQIGKWRKQFTIPNVASCANTAVPDKTLSLPKNHAEGDIPNIAISTGQADTLECLLRRVGLDAAEYGGGASGAGHIHIFQGGQQGGGGKKGGGGGAPNTSPPGPSSAQGLWTSKASLMPYDMVLLSCEGSETTAMNQQALFDYAAAGGRVFASHFHYAWFDTGPFGSANLATWSTGSNDMGDINANIVTSFPKGQALKDWLGNVNALQNGELPITQARHNADVSASNASSQAWVTADQNASPPSATEYFTFNTPIGAPPEQQCGRVVFSDLHVGAASGDYGGGGINFGGLVTPEGCANNDLSPQEKALEFMLFDLSSCVTPDNQPPQPPPPSVK